MSPELIAAIRERIAAGHEKESIKTSVLAMGYVVEVFEAAYVLAQNDLTRITVGAIPTPVSMKRELPSVLTLIADSFEFAKSRIDMVALVAVPLMLLTLFTTVSTWNYNQLALSGLFSGLAIVSALVYIVNLTALLYIVTHKNRAEVVTLSESFSWTKRNIFSLFWVYLLTILAVFGGFLFFFIPGIILLVSLYLAQYVFAVEGKRGMEALLKSRALIHGRWWSVARKIAGLSFYYLLFIIFVTLVYEGVKLVVDLPNLTLIGELLMQLFTAFFTVMSMEVMYRLYCDLSVGTVDEPASSFIKISYFSSVFLGIAAIIGLILLATLIGSISRFDEAVPDVFTSTTLYGEVLHSSVSAEEYKLAQGSFKGVCDVLVPEVSSATNVECNDEEGEWALSASVEGDRWCADTTTPAKQVYTSLEGKLSCVDLGNDVSATPAPAPQEPATSSPQ